MEPRVVDFDHTSRGWFILQFGDDYFRYVLGNSVERGDAQIVWEQEPRLRRLNGLPFKMLVEWIVDRTDRGNTTTQWRGKQEYKRELKYEHRLEPEEREGDYLIQRCEIREQKSEADDSYYPAGFVVRCKQDVTDKIIELRFNSDVSKQEMIDTAKRKIAG